MDRRLTPRGRERRQQLMAFATERFAENGYHPTSVAEIVDGLGVGKGVFYWYFTSKDELFVEILRQAQQDLRRTQRLAIEGHDDPVVRIAEGIRATMAWAADHQELNKLVAFAATEARFAPALLKGQEVAVRDASRHVRDGIESGQIKDLDPDLLAHAIVGVTTQLARVYLHERHRPADEIADAAITVVLEGLLTRDPVTTPS